ncbi:aldehyde dehydrogenase family protein [Microbacterium sp. NPDC076911]|uniref:aldehyde dehydrogenase family protein n=1 Tax=Microbacterium sp. NPDC076911 TaxID=3154958 RepID=UPI00343931B1
MPEVSPKTPAKSAAKRPPVAKSGLSADVREALDADIDRLETGAQMWRHLTLSQRATLMERLASSVGAVAEEWADTAANSKELEPGHPLRGEEWLSGPYGTLTSLEVYRSTLRTLAEGQSPLSGVKIDTAAGGRTRAHVFPLSRVDSLLLSGYTGEIWFEPGVTPRDAREEAGLAQLTPSDSGGVGLVLGAGNITSIPVLDVIYELLAHNRVALLKVNPTQDSLVPVFERALAPLIEPGFLKIIRGDGAVGAYLTTHPRISHVHITGAATTFDAIVWGPSKGAGSAATTKRRRENKPKLTKPITAELGGVSPIIVVPGKWTDADLKFQAEHITTMRLQNSGHNCIAGQVVIVSADWAQREDFLVALRRAYDAAPRRSAWYPRSNEKLETAGSTYPNADWCAGGTRALIEIGADDDASALETTEYFAPVLGVVTLTGNGQEFLDAAVAHANDNLIGTLGANVIVDPRTLDALGDSFERSMADLRYGTIAINAWTALGFLTPTLSWGGFPGASLENVESGIGIVHNALLLDRVERSIVRGPFRPFPRSVGAVLRPGTFSVLPKPPWFVTSRTGASVSEGLTRFRIDRNWGGLAKTLTKAFGA